MDPGITGALIGIGIMACAVCAVVLHDKGRQWKERFQKVTYTQPLLPIVVVRSGSKQWKMKELVFTK